MKMMKLTLLALIISIAGCAASPVWAHPAHGEGMGDAKKAILVVSFGTSVPGAEKNITSLVSAAREAFPDYEVRLAYTSDIIRRKLAKERNVVVPAPFEALAKLNDEGFKRVFVATTLMIPGVEYDNVKSVVGAFSGIEGKYGFEEIRLSKPLMATIPHCERMAEALIKRFERELADKKTAIVLMGHGSPEHFSHALYSQLQLFLDKKAPSRFFVGTVEAAPAIEDIVPKLKKEGKKQVLLSPFMIVAGDHAINDMAGQEDEDSWFCVLRNAGFKDLRVRQEGLGGDPLIAALFIENLKKITE